MLLEGLVFLHLGPPLTPEPHLSMALALGCLLPCKLEQPQPKGANSCLETLELVFYPGPWARFLKCPTSMGWGRGQRKGCEPWLCRHQTQDKFSSLACTAVLPCGALMLSLLAVSISEGRLEEGTCNYTRDDLVLTWSKVLCMGSRG